MIGYNDCRCSRIFRFQCTSSGHNAFDNERHTCHLSHFAKFFHSLAARRRGQILQERKTCAVNIHSNCKRTRSFYQLHFFTDGLQIPRLHCGDSGSACCLDSCGGTFHHFCIGSVTGKCGNSAFCTGINQNIVVCQVIVFISVMQGHSSHRACKERILECPAEQLNGSIDRLIFMDGVHINTDLLPFLVVPERIVSHSLGSRSRHLILTCGSGTDRTDLTVRSYVSSCCFLHLFICHLLFPPFIPTSASDADHMFSKISSFQTVASRSSVKIALAGLVDGSFTASLPVSFSQYL